jgi:hypothetical protein
MGSFFPSPKFSCFSRLYDPIRGQGLFSGVILYDGDTLVSTGGYLPVGLYIEVFGSF